MNNEINYKSLAETITIKRLINKIYPSGIVSLVSDTFDFWDVVTNSLPKLKDDIMKREGTVVIRPDCYDSETKVFTDSGWKYFKDLTKEDLVAQVLEDGTQEFVKPTKYFNEEYEGDMVRFFDHHGKLDLLVTPNHRMTYRQRGQWRTQTADKYTGYTGKCFHRSARVKDGESLTAYERFMIAFQADGSFPSHIPTNEGEISGHRTFRFNFQKQRKTDRLIEICESTGLKYKVTKESARQGQTTIYVHVPVDYAQFPDKTFAWVNPLSRGGNWCDEFCEEVACWDSSKRNEGRFKYDTTAKECAYIVAEVARLAGRGALVSQTSDNRKECFSDVYTVHVLKNNKMEGQSHQKEIVKYKGTIHCVTVPSGRLLVKRNRGTVVCGNSGDPINVTCGLSSRPFEGALEEFREAEYDEDLSTERDYDVLEKDGRYYEFEVGTTWYSSDYKELESITLGKEVQACEVKGLVECLWDTFGGTINSKGYKVLDSHIGAIYGDSITYDRAKEIMTQLEAKGFASSNIVFGIGSYTYQMVTRDTYGMAMKATYVEVDGEGREIFKDPKTNVGSFSKKSAKGLIKVYETEGAHGKAIAYKDQCTWEEESEGLLQAVFHNGELLIDDSFEAIRDRLHN